MAISSRRRFAFTLVELLVVITIIGMLVALLLPAIQGARERGRQLDCLNNMKQITTAAISHDSSRGQLPGYAQFIKRGPAEYATVDYDPTERKFTAKSFNTSTPPKASELNQITGFSWATMLLPRIERSDVWDGIVQPPRDPNNNNAIPVPMPPIATFVCPSDREVSTQPDLAGLSFIMNTGAWDLDGQGFLLPPGKGDTADNGLALSIADYDRAFKKAPQVRIGLVKDGSGTTIMFSENIHKSYEPTPTSGNAPAFSWLFGTEQQLGMVWVVPTSGTAPQPGATINDQEALNRNAADAISFPANQPRFARPSSAHSSGMNITFCGGNGMFLRDDIDYVVYQQLLTPNGRKCVDPVNWSNATGSGQPIYNFRTAPPLDEKDYL